MRTHGFEPVSLMFGLLFTAVGLTFLRGDVELWQIEWSWFWPGVLIVAGGLVLLSLRSSSTAQADPEPAADDSDAWNGQP